MAVTGPSPPSVAAIGTHSARWLPCWIVVVVSLANGCDVTRPSGHPPGCARSGTVVRLQRGAQSAAATVQQHALIARRQFEQIAHVLGAEALDVAHRDDKPLSGGQLLQRLLDESEGFPRDRPVLGLMPGLRHTLRGPPARVPAVRTLEAFRIHRRAAVSVVLGHP